MRPADFFARLEEGPLFPLYYFYGEERYLQDQAVQTLLQRWGEKINRGLNFEVYSGAATPISAIIDNARTFPFLGKRKVILVKEAEKVLTPGKNDRLSAYLKDPNLKTILIFTGKTISFRGNSLSSINQNGLVKEFKHPYSNEIPDWINCMAKDLGKSVEFQATYLILELVGNRLQDISNEMEKLALFIGERKEITREDIEKAVSSLRIESIFDLIDYIGNRKLAKALLSLSQLMESGEPPLKILALITRQFRMIMKVRSLLDQGIRPEKVKTNLKIKNFIWKKLSPQAYKFSRKKLEVCFQRLWKSDLALKTRSIPKKVVLERLIMDLCE